VDGLCAGDELFETGTFLRVCSVIQVSGEEMVYLLELFLGDLL
jgi:hypothetical protein